MDVCLNVIKHHIILQVQEQKKIKKIQIENRTIYVEGTGIAHPSEALPF